MESGSRFDGRGITIFSFGDVFRVRFFIFSRVLVRVIEVLFLIWDGEVYF